MLISFNSVRTSIASPAIRGTGTRDAPVRMSSGGGEVGHEQHYLKYHLTGKTYFLDSFWKERENVFVVKGGILRQGYRL